MYVNTALLLLPTNYRESLRKESRDLKKQLREAKRLKEKAAKEKEEGEQGKATSNWLINFSLDTASGIWVKVHLIWGWLSEMAFSCDPKVKW